MQYLREQAKEIIKAVFVDSPCNVISLVQRYFSLSTSFPSFIIDSDIVFG
jgi:hypothetical protein